MTLIEDLKGIGVVQYGDFTLKSGLTSPYYIDMRRIISYPGLLKRVSEELYKKMEGMRCDVLCGVPYTALPIATAISLAHEIPMVIRRKEPKGYGTKQQVEGVYAAGGRCVVVEDVVTTGASLLETIASLEEVGLEVRDVVAVLDRGQGGREALATKGIEMFSLWRVEELLR